jgi:hypothetical protein
MDFSVDLDQFEREWVSLAEEIVKRVFANERILQIKDKLRANGSLTWEEKSEFITISNEIKSGLIRDRYGEETSPTYQKFLDEWQEWQKERGRKREKATNLYEENIDHFLYGSTPDPEEFLREFKIEEA